MVFIPHNPAKSSRLYNKPCLCLNNASSHHDPLPNKPPLRLFHAPQSTIRPSAVISLSQKRSCLIHGNVLAILADFGVLCMPIEYFNELSSGVVSQNWFSPGNNLPSLALQSPGINYISWHVLRTCLEMGILGHTPIITRPSSLSCITSDFGVCPNQLILDFQYFMS